MAAWRKIKAEIKAVAPSAIIAVSGGVDSVFLLDFVSRCNINYCVAYFDHGLGNGDTDFVRQLAERYKAPFYTDRGIDIAKAPSIEAEARRQRYNFLETVRKDFGGEKIITGQHLNDQVETVILRFLRGKNQNELSMRKFYQNIYRPLLSVEKWEIIRESNYRKLKWIEDISNNDNRFERNWIRNEIIPTLMKRRNIVKTIIDGIPERIEAQDGR